MFPLLSRLRCTGGGALRVLRFLSADVALGALISHRMAARTVGVRAGAAQYFTLGAAVLTTYAADRLSDVRHFHAPPPSARHRFFWQHQRTLTRACAGAV
ncbi:MAG: hypothetical protein WBA12_13490, partial [Catalinimonas sp.]